MRIPASSLGSAATNRRASVIVDANIQAAEYYLDSIAGAPTPMAAADTLDSSTEAFSAPVAITTGQHVLYVHGQDSLGNWGPLGSVLVAGSDGQGPTTTAVTLVPDPAPATLVKEL